MKDSELKEFNFIERDSKVVMLPTFLKDKFGKAINEKIQAKYGRSEAINKVVYDEKDKIIKGSTPFYAAAINEVFREFFPGKNLRTATQVDLERILKENKLPLEGQYEDSSLVLRTKQKPNKYLAKDLFEQFKDKGIELKEDSAYVLPLFTLTLRKDNKSPYKLAFNLTDSTLENYFEAPILLSRDGSYVNPAEMNEKTGLPDKVYKKSISGNRQLWTRNSGLVGLCLNGNLSIDSSNGDLVDSVAYGRVVVVSAEGTAQSFSAKNP